MPMPEELIVVKYGGGAQADPAALCADVAELREQGRRIVLVHGGSAEIVRLAGRLGVPLRDLVAPDGVVTRYTDEATLEVLTLALAGSVKPRLLREFARAHVPAIGVTGLDAGLVVARRRTSVRAVVDGRRMVVRDDHAGRITAVRGEVLLALLDAALLPVLSPPALLEDGGIGNVNADRMAAAVASTLGATQLVFLTEAPGVLANRDDPDSVLPEFRLPPSGGVVDERVGGGMGIKLVAAREALLGGVPHVRISGASGPNPLRQALHGVRGTNLVHAAASSTPRQEE